MYDETLEMFSGGKPVCLGLAGKHGRVLVSQCCILTGFHVQHSWVLSCFFFFSSFEAALVKGPERSMPDNRVTTNQMHTQPKHNLPSKCWIFRMGPRGHVTKCGQEREASGCLVEDMGKYTAIL